MDDTNANQGAIIHADKNIPHGQIEGVPNRSGVSAGEETVLKPNVQWDENTNKTRNKFGETGKEPFYPPNTDWRDVLEHPNDTKTLNNKTRNEQIIHDDGFFNHSASG